ncbi:MAG: ATP-binding protein, partial [Campylobacter sp.]|nr:ATP-binding protein [Campylobacter sp.]
KFIFVAAQNPCPCGNLFAKNADCICSVSEIKRYKNAISSPLLDRIDLYVAMDEVSPSDKSDMRSEDMYKTVLSVFKIQKMRGQKELNGKLSDEEIAKFCILDDGAKNVLNSAVAKYNLSQRGINKTLKVARSIADIDKSDIITKNHILESLSYRIRSEL